MVPGIDPKVDIVFKRLFGIEGNADLLIDLLRKGKGDAVHFSVSINDPRPLCPRGANATYEAIPRFMLSQTPIRRSDPGTHSVGDVGHRGDPATLPRWRSWNDHFRC